MNEKLISQLLKKSGDDTKAIGYLLYTLIKEQKKLIKSLNNLIEVTEYDRDYDRHIYHHVDSDLRGYFNRMCGAILIGATIIGIFILL